MVRPVHKIGRHALGEVAGFSHIEDVPASVAHQVDAGGVRNRAYIHECDYKPFVLVIDDCTLTRRQIAGGCPLPFRHYTLADLHPP